ncbi:MAG: hypothetical protein GC189_06830 [Alphaproteobacteria bacterium]|nr:hypothetical protein [Alphaproteobacteria bacterium]
MRRLTLAAALASAWAGPGLAQTPAAIEVGQLRELNVWTVGAVSRGEALPMTAWSGSSAAYAGALFDRLPAAPDSPAGFALARRLLASPADAPPDPGGAEAAAKRFAALGRMGLADDLAVMAASAGSAASAASVAQYVAQAELARGDMAAACRRAANAGGESQPAFILRLRALCAAAAGERAGADLAIAVARSANAGDPWFESVIGHMVAPAARPPAAKFDTSLNASASLAAGLRAGANPLAESSTLALLTVARGERADPALRAQAAALAFRRGALSPADARRIILSVYSGAVAPPPLARALQLSEAAPGSLETGAAIAQVLRAATAYPDFAAAARLFHGDIAALTAAPDAAAVLVFWRAALAADDLNLARRMAESAQNAAIPEAARASLLTATAIRIQADTGALARRLSLGGDRAARDAGILIALGAPSDAATRAQITAGAGAGGASADPAVMAALAASAQAGATGETAALAAIAVAPGAHALDAASLNAVIAALRAVGLDGAARSIAAEALIGGG